MSGLNDSLALVSSPEVACGFRYDPIHCEMAIFSTTNNIFRPSHFERNQVFIIKEPSKKGAMPYSPCPVKASNKH